MIFILQILLVNFTTNIIKWNLSFQKPELRGEKNKSAKKSKNKNGLAEGKK
jgi:hypothetical protein